MKPELVIDRPEQSTEEPAVTFEPLYNLVLIRPIDKGEYREGRLFLPQTSTVVNQGAKFGEIVAVGCGRLLMDSRIEPLKVKPGDEVYYAAISGADIRLNGERFLIMREEEIMGIIRRKEKQATPNLN